MRTSPSGVGDVRCGIQFRAGARSDSNESAAESARALDLTASVLADTEKSLESETEAHARAERQVALAFLLAIIPEPHRRRSAGGGGKGG